MMVKQTNQAARLSTKDYLTEWYANTPVGKRLHRQIINELDSQLERLFGYHTLFWECRQMCPLKSWRIHRLSW